MDRDPMDRVLEAGGLVALGTDQPIVPVGLSPHLGLRALHRGGLSPAEALRTVTVLPARIFGLDGDLGTVRPGRLADLTVVDGGPFTDFDTLVRTVAVLRGGVPYATDDLVAAYEPVSPAVTRRAADEDDWLAVGRLMRREGCCDTGGWDAGGRDAVRSGHPSDGPTDP